MLSSALFAGDHMLQDIADDVVTQGGHVRLSQTQNWQAPAVKKVQQALLMRDPGCLPVHGADGTFGSETAAAVHRFKVDELGVPEPQVIDDVGPLTAQRLDDIALANENAAAIAARIALLDVSLNAPISGVSSNVAMGDVTIHTNGEDAYLSFKAALDACPDDRAIVVVSGWDFFDSTVVAPGVTVGAALSAAAGRGVRVRALFNHFPVIPVPFVGDIHPVPGDNIGPVAFVNGLPGGAAIHDGRALHHTAASLGLPIPGAGPIQIGVHHMKAWVVFTGDRLLAWCGGVDFNPDRTGAGRFHDVMAQLEGPPAQDVYNVLRDRWNEHPLHPAGITLPALSPTSTSGIDRTRIVTTFGDPTAHAGLNGPPYSFAPTGSTAIRELLRNMLLQAQRFVYIEDQYLVDEQTGKDIAAEMSHLQAVIIVICDTNAVNGELHQAFRRRRELLAHLTPHKSKVAVVFRNNQFVHAKLWIVDDTVALITSANVNRRGYEHDSEIGVAFGGVHDVDHVRTLRERLWGIHLGPHAPAAGTDPVTTLPLWQAPPAGAPVTKYDPAAGTDGNPVPVPPAPLLNADQFWPIVDPPGH